MFGELLDRVLTGTPGAVGVTLMGFDGIAIESRSVDEPGDVLLQSAYIELGAIATQLKSVAASLNAGDVREVAVQTAELTTVLRPLTDEYFVAVSLKPGGNTGKGRYLLRIVGPQLIAELTA